MPAKICRNSRIQMDSFSGGVILFLPLTCWSVGISAISSPAGPLLHARPSEPSMLFCDGSSTLGSLVCALVW